MSSVVGGLPQGDYQAQAARVLKDCALSTRLVHVPPRSTAQVAAAEKNKQNLAKGAWKRHL